MENITLKILKTKIIATFDEYGIVDMFFCKGKNEIYIIKDKEAVKNCMPKFSSLKEAIRFLFGLITLIPFLSMYTKKIDAFASKKGNEFSNAVKKQLQEVENGLKVRSREI